MKTNSFPCLCCIAFVFIAGFATQTAQAEKVLPPSAVTITITVGDAPPGTAVQAAATAGSSAAPAQWIDIKDCTSEMRDVFFLGLRKLEAIANNQFNELTARRAATKNPNELKDLDLAIQNMNSARFFLTAMGELLGRSTTQSWNQQKLKVGVAWVKTQEAYAKVTAHKTS